MSKDDVRCIILRVATRLFAHKGYGSTSMRELSDAAGVTKPTLYYHFGNKESLFYAVVQTHLDHMNHLVEEALATPGTVVERIGRFVDRYLHSATENIDAVRLLISVRHPSDDDPEQPSIDMLSIHLHKFKRLEELITEGMTTGELRSDLSPRCAVFALFGTLNLHVIATIHGLPMPDDLREHLIDLWLHGAATS